jgi:sulfur carrier protein
LRIRLNGEDRQVEATRLDHILEELGYGGAVVATAVNGDFVAVPMREETFLAEDDAIEVLAPMQGG